jgi:hypothetical protein
MAEKNSVEQLIRAAYAFGQDPKVSNVVELLVPLIDVATELNGKTKEELVDIVVAGLDPLIGSEQDALIGGPENPVAPVKVDIPLVSNDGAVLEFASDTLLQVVATQVKQKLAEKPTA